MAPRAKAPQIDAAIERNCQAIDRIDSARWLMELCRSNATRVFDNLDVVARRLQDELRNENQELERRKTAAAPTAGQAA